MRTCIHRTHSGRLCGSPALRSKPRCHNHHRQFTRELLRAQQFRNLPIHTPRQRIRSLNRIFQALVRDQISLRLAGRLLNDIQNATAAGKSAAKH